MAWDYYALALVCINAYFLVATLANIAYFRAATNRPRLKTGPFVSVIVPARNEERAIARCLDSLLVQDYADYEVIVVDDQSSDGTAGIVARYAASEPRLRLVIGVPLAEGWLGKPHALTQGVAAAGGDILIFTDADTVHEPASVSWAVTNLEDHQADILSGYLRQEYGSLGERLIIPTMYAEMMAVPLLLIPRTKSPGLAFAIGQYVAVRREAFDAVGGFEAIKDSIVDDVSLAKRLKTFGYRNVFLDAKGAARCRLYSGYRDAFAGISRSIYSALGASPIAVTLFAAAVSGFIVGPAASLLFGSVRSSAQSGPVAASVALFAVQWALVAWDRDVPFIAVALYPIVFLNLILILGASMLRTGFGPGIRWKDRLVRVPRSAASIAREVRSADAASRSGRVR